jgi:hypothetical protein
MKYNKALARMAGVALCAPTASKPYYRRNDRGKSHYYVLVFGAPDLCRPRSLPSVVCVRESGRSASLTDREARRVGSLSVPIS